MRIDVCTTATLRPRIVARALWSFWRLCFKGHDVRLILNVDPVGQEQYTQQDIVDVAKQYYDEVVVRTPKKANYLKALMWTWRQVESDLFFFLEDDYQLYCPLDLDAMADAFQEHENLALLRLPKGSSAEDTVFWASPHGGHTAKWNGSYYAGGRNIRYSGMPSLIRTAWMRPFLAALTDDRDIEIQFRVLRKGKHPALVGWKYGVFCEPNTPVTAEDIGREWRRSMKIKKNPCQRLTTGFLHWELNGKPYTERLAT